MEVRPVSPVERTEEVAAIHYWNFARKQKRLGPEEEKRLLARSRSGERSATEALVDSYQLLIAALSESYDDDRLSLMDRIAEGNLALIKACRTYLPRRDGSFRRYCQPRIRQAIEHALAGVSGFQVVPWDVGMHRSAVPIDRGDPSDGPRSSS